MTKSYFTLSIVLLITFSAAAQELINGSFAFLSDPSKDYSIVLPSSYEADTPIAAFLALHPLNTANWDGQRWCEELSDFAEVNNVILICPDGGADGAIDDPIDTAFTTVILDSALLWYSIDPSQVYATGFSWGGKTTYTYGLNHADRFAGFMPIGAATNINDLSGISAAAEGKPFYVIHGGNDSPNSRFYPMLERLEQEEACVESNLLPGVGHTIFFPNQVEILTAGYEWLKANNCNTAVSSEDLEIKEISPLLQRSNYTADLPLVFHEKAIKSATIYSLQGNLVTQGITSALVAPSAPGIYIVNVGRVSQQIIVTH